MVKTDDKRDLCSNEVEVGTTDQEQPSSYPPPPQYHHPAQYAHQEYELHGQPPQPGASHYLEAPQPRELPYDLKEVTVIPFIELENVTKSLTFTVILCVSILGLFGLHHFYLDHMTMGFMYAFTGGIFGIGWVVDWFRIGSLVRSGNEEIEEAREKGHWLVSQRFGKLTKRSLVDAYLMWLPPFGWFGAHHFYTGRSHYGLFHAVTFGLHVVGWVVDIFRLPYLVRKANQDIGKLKRGDPLEESHFSLLDAYLLSIPLGLLGLHHFYLGNHRRGVLFLCTMGIFGLGWLADLFQMPMIVAEANKEKELEARVANSLDQQQSSTNTTVVVVHSPGTQYQQHGSNMPEPPPAYMPRAVAGEMVETVHLPPPQVCTSYPNGQTSNHVHLPTQQQGDELNEYAAHAALEREKKEFLN